jgi:MarR family transcriptional regulator, organic hydroperoxide resistance regulator
MMGDDPAATSARLVELLRTTLRQVGYRALAESMAVIQAADLSVPQLAALCGIQRNGQLSVTALSAELRLSLSNTSYLADQLVKRGLLARREDPQDRRQKVLTLTGAATATLDQLSQTRSQAIATSVAALPEPLRQQLETALAQALPFFQSVSDA